MSQAIEKFLVKYGPESVGKYFSTVEKEARALKKAGKLAEELLKANTFKGGLHGALEVAKKKLIERGGEFIIARATDLAKEYFIKLIKSSIGDEVKKLMNVLRETLSLQHIMRTLIVNMSDSAKITSSTHRIVESCKAEDLWVGKVKVLSTNVATTASNGLSEYMDASKGGKVEHTTNSALSIGTTFIAGKLDDISWLGAASDI